MLSISNGGSCFRSLLGALVLTQGMACSFINAPDRTRLQSRDAGRDVDSGPQGEICDNGIDDDGDEQKDCDDFDCISSPLCCGESQNFVDDPPFDASFSKWRLLPADKATEWPAPELSTDGNLGGFLPDGEVRAIRSQQCVPLVFGSTVEATFTSSFCEDCSDYMSIKLSPARDFISTLAHELGVRVTAQGAALVTRGNGVDFEETLAERGNVGPNIAIKISLAVREHLQAAWVFAEVKIADDILLSSRPLLSVDDLDRAQCGQGVRGLYLAIEGMGNAVTGGGDLRAELHNCGSASVFIAPENGTSKVDAQLANLKADMGGEKDFTSGVLSQPTLFQTKKGRWDLAFEGSNLSPDTVGQRVGYAIGRVYADAWPNVPNTDAWRPFNDTTLRPYLGQAPPSCFTPGCLTEESARQPFMFAELTNEDLPSGEVVTAFAEEVSFGSAQNTIVVVRASISPLDVPAYSNLDRRVTPEDVIESVAYPEQSCQNIAHPGLIERERDTVLNSYWLTYLCEEPDGKERIRAVPLSFSLRKVAQASPVTLIADEALKKAGIVAVTGVEPLASFSDDLRKGVLRVWVLGIGTDGVRRIFLFSGRAEKSTLDGTGETAFTDGLPTLTSYPANPVLAPDNPNLAPCQDGCRIDSFAVARARADTDSRRVRFLIGLRKDDDFEFIPLEQFLLAP